MLVASVREAGEIARRYYGGQYKSWSKSRGNPVTEPDIAIDRLLGAGGNWRAAGDRAAGVRHQSEPSAFGRFVRDVRVPGDC